jgi:hypothetical protein
VAELEFESSHLISKPAHYSNLFQSVSSMKEAEVEHAVSS